jgi:6-pyruvoyl-tetrahydropterin synthase
MIPIPAKIAYILTDMCEQHPLAAVGAELTTERRCFVADHYHSLPGFQEPRHGHNWELEATIRNNSLFQLSLIIDDWVKKIDYSLLNEQNIIAGRNPTAEVLAESLFHYLENACLCPEIVRIREKSNCWAACGRNF